MCTVANLLYKNVRLPCCVELVLYYTTSSLHLAVAELFRLKLESHAVTITCDNQVPNVAIVEKLQLG